MTHTDAWRGYGLAFLAAALWATLRLFGKFLYRYSVDPITVVTLRAVIAALTLGGILALRRPEWLRIARSDLPFFVFTASWVWLSITLATFSP